MLETVNRWGKAMFSIHLPQTLNQSSSFSFPLLLEVGLHHGYSDFGWSSFKQ